jgi:hypothetical protein
MKKGILFFLLISVPRAAGAQKGTIFITTKVITRVFITKFLGKV